MAGTARLASTALGLALGRCGAERGLGLVKADALGRDGVPPSSEAFDEARLQRHAPLPGEVCRVAGTAEQPLHLARPAFLLDLDQGLQLSKVMGVAQRMVHALHREVRLPVVVHDDAGDAIEQAAAPGRDPVEGQPGTRGDVQPLGPPADPQAGLVHVLDRCRFHQVADHLDDAFEAPGAASAHPRDGRRNQGDGEQIRHQLGQTIFGQELVVRQVDHHGPDPRAIPHRAGDASRKGGPGLPATSPATATMRPMLHDHQGPGLGQIENLAGTMAGGHLRRQSRTTVRAGLGIMIGNRVGFGDLAQGLALVALLPRPACGPTSRAGSRCAAASASPPAACSVHRWTAACRCRCCSGRAGARVRRAVPPETAPNRSVRLSTRGHGLHDSLDS